MAADIETQQRARERILQATSVVLSRHGYGKLNLSDVAAQAGVSRPTLYKSFSSKDDLLATFGDFELRRVRGILGAAVHGSRGRARVEAVNAFIVDFQRNYPLRALVEIEPGFALAQLGRGLPTLVAEIAAVLAGHIAEPQTVAAALVRIGFCHYLVPGPDEDALLDQLRLATRTR
jgi:AcrR family transcriptional regulator